ncbi:MAG: hypothetical protein K0Q55_213 [Verrucomicrobia bacterium]|jgi:hypothetical protein|nr:hypothetical protein [Verrucomicrobiota bacterium]
MLQGQRPALLQPGVEPAPSGRSPRLAILTNHHALKGRYKSAFSLLPLLLPFPVKA